MFYVSRNGEVIGKFSEEEFREKIFTGEVLPEDYFFTEEMKDWKPVAEYRGGPKPSLPPLPKRASVPTVLAAKKEKSPAYIGGLCAVLAALAPLMSPMLFFLLSLPLLFAAFVLAIISLVRGKIGGGIALLIGLIFAFMMSIVALTERDNILHHPERLRSESRR